MTQQRRAASWRIVHVLRSPVGGLFRHVLDLAAEQSRSGHNVGIICDASTGGALAEQQLAAIAMVLRLGTTRVPMARNPGWGDVATLRHVGEVLSSLAPDIVHGHGAKGGLYARLAKIESDDIDLDPARIYTPHGGSLHFRRSRPTGLVFLGTERFLLRHTDAIIFESEFGAREFRRKIGEPACESAVVHNGLRQADFNLASHDPDATDFLFLGELRELKGLDVLLYAMARLWKSGVHEPTLTVVGDGPDAAALKAQAKPFGKVVRFFPPEPAEKALKRGKCVVLPSRAESLPYVVLEGLSSGLPVIATNVGGIPEIFGNMTSKFVVPPDNVVALASRLGEYLTEPGAFEASTVELRNHLKEAFSIEAMSASVLDVYGRVIEQPDALTSDSFSELNAY
ncbi:MAG: glycosyltransferase family 4 protein [Pseudomonadota bacterium]